jgi:hypothetical protein
MSALSTVSALPSVRLEVCQGGRSVPYLFDQVDFLIGAVAGCDLRVPGTELPAVLCLLARHPDGVKLRRLAPTRILLLNGEAVSRADLNDGDRLTIGAVDIFVRFAQPDAAPAPPSADDSADDGELIDFDQLQADLEERETRLRAERDKLSREHSELKQARATWEAEKSAPRQAPRAEMSADLLQREVAVSRREDEAVKKAQLLDARAAEVERHKQEIAAVRQELNDIRQQLYDRYQERRDRLSGLQGAVDRAARKVQEGKRELENDRAVLSQQQIESERRAAEIQALRAQLDADRAAVDAERTTWHESQSDIHSDLAAKVADLSAREERLANQKQTLEARERQYQTDVLRLDRRQGDIEERERRLADVETDLKARQEQLQSDSAELEAQAQEFDALRTQALADAARIEQEKAEHDARQRQLDQRAAALESQQAALTTLRGKLERMRDEFREHDQALEAQRRAHDEIVRQTADKHHEIQRLEAELRTGLEALAADKQQVVERQAILTTALAKLKDAQDRVLANEQSLHTRSHDVEQRLAGIAEKEALLTGRLEQLADSQSRLDAERQTLRERTVALTQAEQAREALQEQLRRRGEELAQKQKQLHEQLEQTKAKEAAFAEREAALLGGVETTRVALDAEKRVVEEQVRQLDVRREDIAQLDALQQRQLEELHAKSRAVAEQERGLAEQQAKNQDLWRQQQDRLRQDRDDLDALRRQANELLLELPDLELRAGTAVDRLGHAREQLRDHLAELNAFVQQTQDDFAAAHARLRHDQADLAQKDQDFRRLHDEHRVALVAFRQQMIDWQAQIKDVQRLFKKEDKGIENKHAKVDDQAKQVDSAARELATENAILDAQKGTVTEQRTDLDRHVGDLRDWYRRKMRELAGGPEDAALVDPAAALVQEGDDAPLVPTERDILSITGPVDPAEQALAEALAEQQLVEPNALHSLLVEARRQRRSLRQILVATGAVTPYQLALLEAGATDGLALGPFRVVDRLRQSPHETVYRVFDPRRGQEVLVRHLSEDAALDAVLPDEYRQRFTRLMLPDAHVAGVLDVIDLAGRPAVVQEWLVGLPASDWPPLAAAPGVCYRLLTQAALGLSALHKHGLAHGRLDERHLLLTPQGLLKLCGANEPAWLTGPADSAAAPQGDLRRLGQIASSWCSPSGVRKGAKAKPLPERMVAILNRLQADDEQGYANVRALLDDLDQASDDVPANPEAWDRLLRYVRDHALPAATLRQSA